MKIIFLIYSFNIGGIERLLIDLCNGLSTRNHCITLCIINNDYSDKLLSNINSSVNILKLNRPVSSGVISNLKYMNILASYIKNNGYEILHCQGINCVLFSAVAKLINHKLVVLNTVHDSGNYTAYSSFKISIQNLICSHTIAISHSVEKEILSRNISSHKVSTIYNAIDINKFEYSKTDEESRKYPSDPNQLHSFPFEIGEVARFFPAKKGQDTLVYAVEKLLKEYPNLHCSFAGSIFKGQHESYEKLKAYIKTHNIEKSFSFLDDIEDVPSFLQKLDIFILPSNYEGFGISLIEAMSSGVPSVASRLDGPEEIFSVFDNYTDTGCLFTPGDPDDLASKISYVLLHLNNYDRQKISDFARRNFSSEQMVCQYQQLYHDLTG